MALYLGWNFTVYDTHVCAGLRVHASSAEDRPKPTYLRWHVQGGPKKRGHRLVTIILSNLNRFTFFFTGRFLSKFAVKLTLKIPPHLAYVATLPCETLMPAKQAINDKLQGSVLKCS